MATTLRALRPVRETNGTTPLLAKALIADDERAVLDWAQKEGWRMVEPLPAVYAPYNALVLIGDIQRPYVAVVEAQKYNHSHGERGRFVSSIGGGEWHVDSGEPPPWNNPHADVNLAATTESVKGLKKLIEAEQRKQSPNPQTIDALQKALDQGQGWLDHQEMVRSAWEAYRAKNPSVQKYNPNHDSFGRFSSIPGGGHGDFMSGTPPVSVLAPHPAPAAPSIPLPSAPNQNVSDLSQQLTGKALRNQMAQELVNQALDKVPVEVQARVAGNIALTNQMIAEEKTTQQMYDLINGKAGSYIPGYEGVLHGIVNQEFDRQVAAGAKPEGKLTVIGGLGGSGKSSLLRDHGDELGVNPKDYITINPDDMKALMIAHNLVPGYDGIAKSDLSPQIHETSGDMATMLAAKAMENGYNTLYDVTLGSPNKAGRVLDNAVNNHAYDPARATSLFVDVPVQTSLDRAMQRWKGKDGSYTGRFLNPQIPASHIDETGKYNSINRGFFEQDRARFGTSQVIDNSGRQAVFGPRHHFGVAGAHA